MRRGGWIWSYRLRGREGGSVGLLDGEVNDTIADQELGGVVPPLRLLSLNHDI